MTYASASAASIFIGSYSCEGNIIHVQVNRSFSDPLPGNSQNDRVFFSLGNDAKFWLGHFVGDEYAAALFEMYSRGLIAGQTVGDYNNARGLKLVSRIAFGVPISQQNFTDGYYPGILADNYRGAFGEWLTPGPGFIGFSFNLGSGVQYGWARVIMDGSANLNTFTFVDYAYGTPGERVRTGQVATPDSGGSLGLLAIGGASLIAWRGIRARGAAAD